MIVRKMIMIPKQAIIIFRDQLILQSLWVIDISSTMSPIHWKVSDCLVDPHLVRQ